MLGDRGSSPGGCGKKDTKEPPPPKEHKKRARHDERSWQEWNCTGCNAQLVEKCEKKKGLLAGCDKVGMACETVCVGDDETRYMYRELKACWEAQEKTRPKK